MTGGAFDAYLTLRGVRTLSVRYVRQHLANAEALVDAVAGHPAVARLFYPGLPDHPGHAAARQMDGFGAIVSLELVGGEPAVAAFLTGLADFSLAESLAASSSLVCHPSTMTHAAMPPDVQAAAGLTPGLIRFSAGIEDPADLVADVRAGLDRALCGALTQTAGNSCWACLPMTFIIATSRTAPTAPSSAAATGRHG